MYALGTLRAKNPKTSPVPDPAPASQQERSEGDRLVRAQ
jgi:hypothetical protein